MAEFGYAISSEEHRPLDLVRFAERAEQCGFAFALISDHFHPWVDAQGQSPFVWAVLGGIARATTRLRLGTGVTCPLLRVHPAIVAQAAATAGAMMEGRFFLGVGAGENLNEPVLGDKLPEPTQRLAMLAEAIAVIRLLWQGGKQTHHGRFYTVDEARVYTLPETPVPLYVAGGGSKSSELAGRVGDGFISTVPKRQIVDGFEKAGGRGKPRYGQVTVCWAASADEARTTAHRIWPNAALGGDLSWEIKTPKDFEDAVKHVRPEDVAEEIVCGPDRDRHVEKIRKFVDAGYDHVYVHQVGPDQEGFFRFYEREVLPALR
jgi:G6PDH family F420-dependent oxidoreductase